MLMTIQEKKKILKDYAHIEKRVKELRDEVDMLQKLPTTISPSVSGVPRGGNGDGNKVERAYEHLESLIIKLKKETDELILLEHRIVEAIQTLPNQLERRVLTLAYIGKCVPAMDGKTQNHRRLSLFNIANEMSYSYDRIKQIHGSALSHLKL